VSEDKRRDVFDVRESGAKGDGKSDDTKAIQDAFDAAAKEADGVKQIEDGADFINAPVEVFFPRGKYIISDTIKAGVVDIRGQGSPIIQQQNAERDVFYYPWAWRGTISGITLVGGRTSLNLGNTNIDKGHFVVEKCRFYHASGPAIHFRKGSNSSFLIVKDCVIVGCRQALISHTDWTTLRDTWITTDREMDNMAVIENYGFMTLDNMLGVPLCGGVDARWIDNYGNLHCYGCRFGGEGGGFTPVVNFTKYSQQADACWILIQDSCVAAQSNFKRKCVVYCEEIPNGIEIRNCAVSGVPPFKVDKRIDLNTYFRGAKPGMLKYACTNCYGEFVMDIPELLKNPIIEGGVKKEQLSEDQTKKALERAVEEVKSKKWPESKPAEFKGRKEQTSPNKYIDITPETHRWDLTDYMDATREPNGEYIAVAQAADDIVLLRRISAAQSNWPHVLIKDVKVDLDRYPYLSWRVREVDTGSPKAYAVRIIDVESGKMASISDIWRGIEYQAYNVKEKLGVSGARTLDIRFYYIGQRYIPGTERKPFRIESAKAGDYMVLDFLRFEAE